MNSQNLRPADTAVRQGSADLRTEALQMLQPIQFCTISYSFPQLFPSSLCLPTIIPTCGSASLPYLFPFLSLWSPRSFCQASFCSCSMEVLIFQSSQFLVRSASCLRIFWKIKFLERQLADSAFNTVLSHNISVSTEEKSSQIMQCADLAATNGEFGHCRDVWFTALPDINSPWPHK